MRNPATVALALLVLGGCAATDQPTPSQPTSDAGTPAAITADGVPAVEAEVLAALRRYQNTRSAQLLGWLDGGVLIATRFGATTQLHHVATPLGNAAADHVRRRAGASRGGESGCLRRLRLPEGHRRLGVLPDLPLRRRARHGNAHQRWQIPLQRRFLVAEGKHIGYSTTEGNSVDWDLHTQDLQGRRRVVQQGEGVGWRIEDWSDDESRLLVSRYISVNESRLYEIDLDAGSRRRLLGQATAAYGGARYGLDGAIYFTSDADGEFMRLTRLDTATGKRTVLTDDIPWDVSSFALSPDHARLAFVVNENGVSRLYAFETADGRFTALPEIPPGIVSGLRFDPNADRLGFTVRSATAPSDAYSIDFGSRRLTRWTMSELGGLQRSELVAPSLIEYSSFDGRTIPAFIYRPTHGGPHPVIIDIHGGPEGQARPGFSPTTQFYVNELGVAVIFPNVRGSAGYGKSYLKLDNGRLREDSVRDIGALLDWIAEQPGLDAERVAVMGGSYGGYMVLASLVHFGERLRGGVERVGISNFVTFLENTQPYRQDLRRAEYGDERDPDMRTFLESISPLNRVDEIDKPLLISQGLNDPRVPASESAQIVAALKARGVPVGYVLADNEGHGFRKKENRDYLTAVTAEFLSRQLRD